MTRRDGRPRSVSPRRQHDLERKLASLEGHVLDAVRAERAIERGARGKPWDDETIWPVYIRAVERRRAAVDAWLDELPEPEPEAASVPMAL